MSEKKIIIEYELPVYPSPIGQDTPKEFQTAGKIRLMTDMVDDDFVTADILTDKGRELQSRANFIVKGAMDVMRSDESALKYFLVGDKVNLKTTTDTKQSTYTNHHEREKMAQSPPNEQDDPNKATSKQIWLIRKLMKENHKCLDWMDEWQERERVAIDDLSKRHASDIIKAMKEL